MLSERLTIQDNRSERAWHWFVDHNVEPFSDHDIVRYLESQKHELNHNWNFRDSKLAPRSASDTLRQYSCAAVWVQGGSKERFGFYQAIDTRNMVLLSGNFEYPTLIPNEQLTSVNQMFDHLTQSTRIYYEPVFQGTQVDVLGDVYSNAGKSVLHPYGIDIQPEPTAKGLNVRGITKILVGNELIYALQRGGVKIDKDTFRVICNDVIKLLGDAENSRISIVLGTGFNIGAVGKVKHNGLSCFSSEIADSKVYNLSDPEKEVNKSERPGRHLAEMIAGGRSMGLVLTKILQDLTREGILPFQVNAILDSSHITSILTNNRGAFINKLIGFKLDDDVSWGIMQDIATTQVQRASVVVSVSLAAIFSHFEESFQQMDTIQCPYEGSTFKFIPGLKEEVQRLFYLLTGHRIEFIEGQAADGAAFFALREFEKHFTKSFK
jgi:hypothetical protein